MAPASTAMQEYLTEDVAYLAPAHPVEVRTITSPGAQPMVRKYGKPGLTCFEVSVDDARAVLRRAFANKKERKAKAHRARKHVLRYWSWPTVRVG